MISLISIGFVLLLVIGYLFIRQISQIIQNTPSKLMSRTMMLCGIYSITGSAAFVSLVAYRAAVFCDSVSHFAFLLCAYQYFTLIIDYYGGESEFIKHTNGLRVFNIQTPPCCCCLQCILPSELTKYVTHLLTLINHSDFFLNDFFHFRNKFKMLRIMVLQMSIVQGTLLFLLNVFNSIDTVSLIIFFLDEIVLK